jgi:hypothetical protein
MHKYILPTTEPTSYDTHSKIGLHSNFPKSKPTKNNRSSDQYLPNKRAKIGRRNFPSSKIYWPPINRQNYLPKSPLAAEIFQRASQNRPPKFSTAKIFHRARYTRPPIDHQKNKRKANYRPKFSNERVKIDLQKTPTSKINTAKQNFLLKSHLAKSATNPPKKPTDEPTNETQLLSPLTIRSPKIPKTMSLLKSPIRKI